MSVVFKRSILKPFSSSALPAGVAQLSQEYIVDEFQVTSLLVALTAVSGSPTSYALDAKIQYSPDTSGSRWYDLPSGAIAQIVSVASVHIDNISLLTARRIRISYTLAFIDGTNPTATISMDLALITNSAISSISLNAEDIQIGAVEIKNSTDDTHAVVGADGLYTEVRTIRAGENHIGEIGGKTIRSTGEFTRTTGITAYDANDAVLPAAGGLVEIANVGRIAGGSGYITEIRVSTDKKSITPRFRIHLFNASNPTISADGANWQDKYADVAKRIGYIDMPALSTPADTTNSDMSMAMDATIRLPFICVGTSLWYAIETLDAFTPADSEKFSLYLHVEQN